MNLKVLFMILLYYSFISLFWLGAGSVLTDASYTQNVELNDTGLTANETGTGGIFSTGISFARYFTIVAFGIGLPGDVPNWMTYIVATWQTLFTIFSVGFIISSIWDG